MKKVLALDIGVTSLGWAVTEYKDDKKEWDIKDFGVRIWDAPEDPQTLDTKTSQRRLHRSARRLNQRKQNRKKDLKKYLINQGLISQEIIDEHFNKINTKNNGYDSMQEENNPLSLRYKGLNEKLTDLQLYLALLNILKYRGYNNKFDIDDKDKDSSKNKELLSKADQMIEKYNYPINYIFEINKHCKYISYHNNAFSSEYKDLLIEKYKAENKSDEEIKKLILEEEEKNNKSFILFKRKDYERETKALLEKQQQFNPKISDEIVKHIIDDIIFRQRDFEDGPGPKDEALKKKWKEWMAMNHKKHLIYKSFMENKGRCRFLPDQERASSLSVENDLYYILNESSEIISYALKGNNRNKEDENIKKAISLITKEIIEKYLSTFKFNEEIIKQAFENNNIDYKRPSQGISFAPPKATFLSKLVKNNKDFLINNLKDLDLNNLKYEDENNKVFLLGKVLEENKTIERLEKELKFIDPDYFKEAKMWLKNNINVFRAPKTASVSKKFIQIALDKTLNEGILLSDYQAKEEEKIKLQEEKEIKKVFAPIIDQDMIKNAVVFRSINQVRKVVKVLYQKEKYFDSIVIEVGKALYAEKDRRKNLRSTQDIYEKNNTKIIQKLIDANVSVTKDNILREKIWEQTPKFKTDKTRIYDLYDINLKTSIEHSDIFRGDKIQVDHIIPYSLLNDNTINNKVLTTSGNNALKGKKTPIQWFESIGKTKKEINAWIKGIDKLFKGRNANELKSSYLKKSEASRNVEWGFESRNINDTRYITRYIIKYLEINLASLSKIQGKKPPQILSVQGIITSKFRRLWLNPYVSEEKGGSLWGISQKNRDITPFHHAIDALVLANMHSKELVEFYQSIIRYYDFYNFLVKEENKSRSEITVELRELHTKIKEQLNKNSFFKNDTNKTYFLNQVDTIYANLIEKILNKDRLRPLSFVNYDVYKMIHPLIFDFGVKINNLIPVKIEEVKIPKEYVNEKGEKYEKEEVGAKFNSLVSSNEWSQLNNRDISEFPYVSYRESKRLRGSVLQDQNPISHKNAEKKDPETITKDKNGNFWTTNNYIGFYKDQNDEIKKLKYIDVLDDGERKNIIITRNTTFKIGNDIYIYRGVTGKRILVSHPNIKYSSQSKFNNIFDFWPTISSEKLKSSEKVFINLLGKRLN